MQAERMITPSELIRVILAERPGHSLLAREGIRIHQEVCANALLRAQPVLDGFGPTGNAITIDSPEVCQGKTYRARLDEGLILSTEVDLEVGDRVIEIKPTLRICHGIQVSATCMAKSIVCGRPVEGGLYFYEDDQYRRVPQGGESIWPELRILCDVAEQISLNQVILDQDKERQRRSPKNPGATTMIWQPTLPLLGDGEPRLLSETERVQIHKQSVQLRRELLDPTVKKITPVIESWLRSGLFSERKLWMSGSMGEGEKENSGGDFKKLLLDLL